MSLYNAQISYPLIKNDKDSTSYLTPKLAFNFSPNGMKNYTDNIKKMDVDNIFNMNRLGLIDTLESGKNLTLGIDYKKERLDNINKYFEFNLATVLRAESNNKIPSNSTLDKKNSNYFGKLTNNFNENISNWDVGNVTNMISMFANMYIFNQPIGNWNVGNVTNMSYMFDSAHSFNGDLSLIHISEPTRPY